MDLSFALLNSGTPVRALPMAVLLAEIAARQAASPTARAQASLVGMRQHRPGPGRACAFNRATAAMLSRRGVAVKGMFT